MEDDRYVYYQEVDKETWEAQLKALIRRQKRQLRILLKLMSSDNEEERKYAASRYYQILYTMLDNTLLLETAKDEKSSLYYFANGIPVLITVDPKLKELYKRRKSPYVS